MEEDIKTLEKYLEYEINSLALPERQALENLIEAYKELKEIEENHRKENGKLRERVKELEEENEIIKGNYYTLSADIQMVTSKLRFPEDTIIADEMVSMIKENYIPKFLVEEKIEELKNRIEKYREYAEQGIETDVEWVDNVANRETVKVLQELLEGRK